MTDPRFRSVRFRPFILVSLLAWAMVQTVTPAHTAQQPASKPTDPKTPPQQPAAQSGSIQLTDDIVRRKWTGDLDGMVKRRLIRVLVAYNKTHYFIDKGVQRGITYDALKQFEDELNKRLKTGHLRVHVVFLPMSRDQMAQALLEGQGDVIAANITITPERQKIVDFAEPTLTNVREVVVSGPGGPNLASVDDLAGQEVHVREKSIYDESLQAVNASLRKKGKPEVVIKRLPIELEDEDILEMVNAGLVKTTVVDDHLARFWKQIFTNIVVHDSIAVRTEGAVAMAIRKNSPKLKAALDEFVKTHGRGTAFGNMTLRKYFQNAKYAKNATSESEMKKFREVVGFFRKYGDKYDVDWLLMLAQGYQESGLDQAVQSKVGAVGVMQVMPKTGAELNVGDIKKIEPNVHAGVKYIRFMIDEYFKDEPMDRLNKGLFAFASYNAGPARIRQLRRETERRGLNPNVWFNNVERVVAEKIGRETVQYVSNIYKYYVAYKLAYEEIQQRRKATGGGASRP